MAKVQNSTPLANTGNNALRAALVPSLLLLTAHGFALIAVRHARLVVVRASDLDEGDALLAEAVGALQDLRVAVASERVERARDCYARVADARRARTARTSLAASTPRFSGSSSERGLPGTMRSRRSARRRRRTRPATA